MARRPGTRGDSRDFDAQTVEGVWRKGRIVAGYDPVVYRQDACGAWMKRTDYGDTSSQYGWEVDHEMPVAKGGTDILSNLQPLHWRNNRGKGDDWPRWYCTVGSK